MFRSRTNAIGWKPRKKEAGPEMQGTRYWSFRIPTSPPRLPHALVLPFIIVYLSRSLERPHAYTDYFRLGSLVAVD